MSTQTLDLDNIQGDVLGGLPKMFQTFLFFNITNSTGFKTSFKDIIPLITTATQAKQADAAIVAHKASHAKGLLTLPGTNVAFSTFGLAQLGVDQTGLGDSFFTAGQLADARGRTEEGGLNDPLTPGGDIDWDEDFKQNIHGCFNITGDTMATVESRKQQIETILSGSITIVTRLDGAVRQAEGQQGHEHFGFKDGVSQPPVIGFNDAQPGEVAAKAGVILIGEDGDPFPGRPAWAKSSSFLAFRKLKQLVPEFNDFLNKNPILDAGLTPAQGSELLGARLVGRWKSGAPIDKDPLQDNPEDATKEKANDFDYTDEMNMPQTRCPFAAHLRKMNPRGTVPPGPGAVASARIIRQGIPYGPEVTPEEASSATTQIDRGLLFDCYQSSIQNGFHFLQNTWANNAHFPSNLFGGGVDPGFDPIIGQSGGSRTMTGFDPVNATSTTPLSMQPFVVPRGGEYFLVPSISALKGPISAST